MPPLTIGGIKENRNHPNRSNNAATGPDNKQGERRPNVAQTGGDENGAQAGDVDLSFQHDGDGDAGSEGGAGLEDLHQERRENGAAMETPGLAGRQTDQSVESAVEVMPLANAGSPKAESSESWQLAVSGEAGGRLPLEKGIGSEGGARWRRVGSEQGEAGPRGKGGDVNQSSMPEVTTQHGQVIPLKPGDRVPIRYIIIDCSTMTYIDTSGVDMLHLIITQYSRAGVTILLAGIPAAAMRILTNAKFFEHENFQRVYHAVTDALTDITQDIKKDARRGVRYSIGSILTLDTLRQASALAESAVYEDELKGLLIE
jgi:ABC-type transporter Mla MlaB component